MKTFARFFLATLSLACVGVLQARQKQIDPVLRDKISEAVIRFEMQREMKKDDFRPASFLVAVMGKDASSSLLKQFAGSNPPVRRASRGSIRKDSIPWILYDRDLKEESVQIEIVDIRQTGAGRAEVFGGYFCGSLCAERGIYKLVLRDNQWTVEEFQLGGIA